MGFYDLHFAHKLGAQEACRRVEAQLGELASQFRLQWHNTAQCEYHLFGSGIDAKVSVGKDDVRVGLDMSLITDMIAGGRIRQGMAERIPRILE